MANTKGKCVYNIKWETNESYKEWLTKDSGDKHKAMCIVCNRSVDVSSMGESALKSHMKESKHIENTRIKGVGNSVNIKSFLTSVASDKSSTSTSGLAKSGSSSNKPDDLEVAPASAGSSLSAYTYKLDDVLKAEVIWTLNLICSHQSYKSAESSGKVFQTMFPDSEIAKQFACGERKTSYICVFGLAEFFKSKITKDITGYFVVLFDESLNKKMKQKQMDIHIRFWSECSHKIETRYFTSEFIGHATSDDITAHFTGSVLESRLDIGNMLQISMDGPNVNWKFFDSMKQQVLNDYDSHLLNIGSRGLHVVHNGFKSGAETTEWGLSSFLSSLYYLFKDFPARREDFVTITGSSLLPLKFVSQRWLENVPVCQRALDIMDNVVKYEKAVESKKVSKPTCKSNTVVKEAVLDKCLVAKLHFFKSVALQLEPFLTKFQASRPMVCFLHSELSLTIRTLLRRIIKPEVLDEKSDEQLSKLNVEDQEFHLDYSKIDVGFSCERALKESKVVDRSLLEFRLKCKSFIVALLEKILLKCPIHYALVRHLTCLNPNKMAYEKTECAEKFKKVLGLLLNYKKFTESECEQLQQEYSSFLDNIPVLGISNFTEFNADQDV